MSGSLPLSPHIDQTADIERVRFRANTRLRRLIRLHRPRTISAGIKANAWSLPEHPHVSDISRIKGAVAIPQAANKSAARLFTKNVAVWQSPLAHRLLDYPGKIARHAPE